MKLTELYNFDWHRIPSADSYHIEYSITDICNRSCASCSHLAPLAKMPNFVGVDEFTSTVRIISRLVPDAHTFWLTGGEPTLHPRFMELLAVVRRAFENSFVGIFSNGLTLKQYEDDATFWDFMQSNGIVWAITTYEMSREYFIDLFAAHGCNNNLVVIQSGAIFSKLTNYRYGQPVSWEKYENCGTEKNNVLIRGGKIYNCPCSAFADLFNAYFGERLKVNKKDHLIVDEKLTRKQIDEFRGPMPFCAQCDPGMRYYKIFKNVPSNKRISEWSSFYS